ncbi:MAG: flagellar biosynthesis protein FlgA [SAR202 cluster bacterium]|nr:flagellar biosynthesis protein FlgA [SAR202 cluster bacterium]
MRERLMTLDEIGKPIRVSLIGCGRFGSMVAAQVRRAPGMVLSVACDIDLRRARRVIDLSGYYLESTGNVTDVSAAEDAVQKNQVVITDRLEVALESDVDVVVEATGNPELGAMHCFLAIENRRHVVNASVEADVLVGPQLKRMADEVGVVYSLAYGDQPALIDDLYDWAIGLGFEVVAAGKGTKYLPEYRWGTPDEALQRFGYSDEDAAGNELNTRMYNSFVDGTKSAVEMCAVANMTGLVPDVPGMHLPAASIAEIPQLLRPKTEGGILSRKGVVEVISCVRRDGSEIPDSVRWGVYVVITSDSLYLRRCLSEYGVPMDDAGIYGVMYKPYHFIGMEVPLSIGRAMLYKESTGAPIAKLCEVAAVAKSELNVGQILDGEGGYTVYGALVDVEYAKAKDVVPIGLCHGAKVVRQVASGQMIHKSDLDLPKGGFVSRLLGENVANPK